MNESFLLLQLFKVAFELSTVFHDLKLLRMLLSKNNSQKKKKPLVKSANANTGGELWLTNNVNRQGTAHQLSAHKDVPDWYVMKQHR